MLSKGKVERVCATVLQGLPNYPAGLPCYLGFSPDEQTEDLAYVAAANLREEPSFSGNYFVDITFGIKSHSDRQDPLADDPSGDHAARVEAIFGDLKDRQVRQREVNGGTPALNPEDGPCLAELLSSAEPDFYVFDEIEDLGSDPNVEGRRFVEGITFRIYCCGQDLS